MLYSGRKLIENESAKELAINYPSQVNPNPKTFNYFLELCCLMDYHGGD
jgi:hypothetical protein